MLVHGSLVTAALMSDAEPVISVLIVIIGLSASALLILLILTSCAVDILGIVLIISLKSTSSGLIVAEMNLVPPHCPLLFITASELKCFALSQTHLAIS